MSFLVRLVVVLLLVGASVAVEVPATAQGNASVQVATGVSYELIGRWDVDKLNQVLKVEAPKQHLCRYQVAVTQSSSVTKLNLGAKDSVSQPS